MLRFERCGNMKLTLNDFVEWREQYPNLARLQDRLESRQSFKATVPYAQVIRDKVV